MNLDKDNIAIGDNIRKARETLEITRECLAKPLGVGKAQIAKYERGEASLKLTTAALICIELDIDLIDLLEGTQYLD